MPSVLDPTPETADMSVPVRINGVHSGSMTINYPVARWPWTDPAFRVTAARDGVDAAVKQLPPHPLTTRPAPVSR